VFLDRDGVLNPMVDRDGRLRAPLQLSAFTPYASSGEAVRRLHAGDYLCIVATNQPEVATGELAPTVLEAMHERLRRETGVDAVYVCPHRDEDRCVCRKPRPGLLLRAAHELSVDLPGSFLVGDAGATPGRWSVRVLRQGGIRSEVIVGSIRHMQDVNEAMEAGADIVTVPPKFFRPMTEHPKTTEAVQQFLTEFRRWNER
jgi:D-glycero-D-manno-heptose 1,7-bisphosphate phosphatase